MGDAALPLDLGVHAVLDGLVPGLGLIPVPRPVAVGGLDGVLSRGVLEADPGVSEAVGVLEALEEDAVEDAVEVGDTVEEPVEEPVEDPADSAPPVSPAAKSFGPGI